jgi:hypothetical protein
VKDLEFKPHLVSLLCNTLVRRCSFARDCSIIDRSRGDGSLADLRLRTTSGDPAILTDTACRAADVARERRDFLSFLAARAAFFSRPATSCLQLSSGCRYRCGRLSGLGHDHFAALYAKQSHHRVVFSMD